MGASAGERRGRLGIVGMSNASNENAAACAAFRWGNAPIPVVEAGSTSSNTDRPRPSGVPRSLIVGKLISPSWHFTVIRDDSFRPTGGEGSIAPTAGRDGTDRVDRVDRRRCRHTGGVAVKIERLVPWLLRLLWLLTGLAGSAALDHAIPAGTTGATVTTAALGLAWAAGVVAMMIPAVRSLTAVRAIVPLSIPAAIATWAAGADPVAQARPTTVVFLGAALAAAVVASTAELGRSFVQASAYGAEERHVLRPPPAYLAAAVLSWLVTAAALTAGLSAIAGERWTLGVPLTVVGAAIGGWSWPRWHRLARRWFVVVPVGVVIHDPLVLAETLMLRHTEIAALGLAPAGTDAADLTGPAGGHAIEITTTSPVTAVYAGTPRRPGGRAVHLTACLVAPSRPGRALAAATRR